MPRLPYNCPELRRNCHVTAMLSLTMFDLGGYHKPHGHTDVRQTRCFRSCLGRTIRDAQHLPVQETTRSSEELGPMRALNRCSRSV